MKNDFRKFNIQCFAISKDNERTAAIHQKRDKLSLRLLCDSNLKVIKQFGLEHHKAIEVSGGKFNLFGIHLALLPSIKTMAVPTTMLIDEAGKILWIDQADDYRIRSNNERVLAEVVSNFT